ncbi:MAG: hypothetical protein Kow0010_15590 [Dehalococcoidia bacterium]
MHQMRLAKPHVDVGLFTQDLDPQLAFWKDQAGLPFEELLPTGGGNRQYRHAMNGSVLKLNHPRDPLPPEPLAGYRHLFIASGRVNAPVPLRDPDGNAVTLVPPGHDGIVGIRIHLHVSDEPAFHRFYGGALQLEPTGERAYRCGDSIISFERDDGVTRSASMRGPGYRYLTIQVWDVDDEHLGLLARGAAEGAPPRTLGDVARISFVRDPDDNWIEISQRASLTGTL